MPTPTGFSGQHFCAKETLKSTLWSESAALSMLKVKMEVKRWGRRRHTSMKGGRRPILPFIMVNSRPAWFTISKTLFVLKVRCFLEEQRKDKPYHNSKSEIPIRGREEVRCQMSTLSKNPLQSSPLQVWAIIACAGMTSTPSLASLRKLVIYCLISWGAENMIHKPISFLS